MSRLMKNGVFILLITIFWLTDCHKEELPNVVASIKYISSNYAEMEGEVVNLVSVDKYGFCWSIDENPTIDDEFTSDEVSSCRFVSKDNRKFWCKLDNLKPEQVYYVRAYASNRSGTVYSEQYRLQTRSVIGQVLTKSITNITCSSANSGTIFEVYGENISVDSAGICWNVLPNPDVSNSHTSEISNAVSLNAHQRLLQNSIENLNPNTTYYVRAFAAAGNSIIYGQQLKFTTQTGVTIGDFCGGGYVFYIDSSGQHGLIATLVNPNCGFCYSWGCEDINIAGASGTAVGRGKINTAAILNACSEVNIAARYCDGLDFNGYSDWYLPSKDELDLIYKNLFLKGIGNFSTSSSYWSSTQSSSKNAFAISFISGTISSTFKSSYKNVIAIRDF